MSTLKIILCLGILGISAYIGNIYSRKLEKKTKEYIDLQNILMFIRSKIIYANEDIISIFKNICEQYINRNWENLFNVIINKINNEDSNIYETINNSIKICKENFCCELNILSELGKVIGKSNLDDQIKYIDLLNERVINEIENSRCLQNKNERLYRNLGIICGTMLVIVLI